MAQPPFDWSFTFGYSPFRVDPFSFSPYVSVIAFSPPNGQMLVIAADGCTWSLYAANLSTVLFTRAIVNQGGDPTSFLSTLTLLSSGNFCPEPPMPPSPPPFAGQVVSTYGANGLSNVLTPNVTANSGQANFGFDWVENFPLPTAPVNISSAIGWRNDFTVSGNASNLTGGDILSGNYTIAYGVLGGPALTGTFALSGGFQSGVYINNATGAVFSGIRGYVLHFENNSVDTINLLTVLQPVFTNNAGTISNCQIIAVPDTTAVPGGGTFGGRWIIANFNDPSWKIESVGLGRLGSVDVTGNTGGVTNGLRVAVANQLDFLTNGAVRATLNSAGFSSNASHGPILVSGMNTTGTLPVLCPDQSDRKAGFGADAPGDISAITDVGGIATENTRFSGKYQLQASYTVATLPAAVAGLAGAKTFASDANATTFNSVVAGGGTNFIPVYCDGTNWRIG